MISHAIFRPQVRAYMDSLSIGFSAETVDNGRALSFMRALGSAFFKLTAHKKALFDAHAPAACKAPAEFGQFCGFSQYDRPGCHKQRPALGQAETGTAVAELQALDADYSELQQPAWGPLRTLVK